MICCLVVDPAGVAPPGALESIARSCSPRVSPHGDRVVLFDASGLTALFGAPAHLAEELRRQAVARQLDARVVLAATSTAAWILAHARPGVAVVPAGQEAAALASVPLAPLAQLPEMALAPDAPERRRARARHFRMAPAPGEPAVRHSAFAIAILERWGLRTLGDLARLPRADLQARLGAIGVRLHQAACGEDAVPLVPVAEAVPWIERVVCEWPLDGLEPLSFVLGRICETLSARLERADRGAVDVTTCLRLVTRGVHVRTLHLPSPLRDARGLRTLMLLDLESHPPGAAIDVVDVVLGVTPGRIVQGSLLARAVPAPEDLATLEARLGALMGETRIGAPVRLDTHDERAVGRARFAPDRLGPPAARASEAGGSACARTLRRFRLPVAARVVLDQHRPVRVVPAARGLAGGAVTACAGPWRTSGGWWALDRGAWDRDGWEVALTDGVIYRLARDRATGRWEIEGTLD